MKLNPIMAAREREDFTDGLIFALIQGRKPERK